jgi:hypothetical protein
MQSLKYEIKVSGGVVPESLLEQFEGMRLSTGPAEITLHGDLADQAALYGLLRALRSSGLVLVDVRRLPGSERIPPQGGRE